MSAWASLHLLFWQEWCECKELGARDELHAKAATYSHMAKEKRQVSILIIVRANIYLEKKCEYMQPWMEWNGGSNTLCDLGAVL